MSRMTRWLLIVAAALVGGGAGVQKVAAPGRFVPQQAISYGAAGSDAVPVDAAHPLPVAATSGAVPYFDRSGVIAVANAAQQVAAANPVRRGFLVQNLSGGDLWLGLGSAASVGAPAIRLAAGQLYEAPASGVPAGVISVAGATAGQTFTAKEW